MVHRNTRILIFLVVLGHFISIYHSKSTFIEGKQVWLFDNKNSDVFGEQKSGLGRIRGLLFGFGSGLGINISGTSSSGFRVF